MSAPAFVTRWRNLEDLAGFLTGYIRGLGDGPITEGEDIIKAHRRAAEVNLAQRIVATIEWRYDNDDDEEE